MFGRRSGGGGGGGNLGGYDDDDNAPADATLLSMDEFHSDNDDQPTRTRTRTRRDEDDDDEEDVVTFSSAKPKPKPKPSKLKPTPVRSKQSSASSSSSSSSWCRPVSEWWRSLAVLSIVIAVGFGLGYLVATLCASSPGAEPNKQPSANTTTDTGMDMEEAIEAAMAHVNPDNIKRYLSNFTLENHIAGSDGLLRLSKWSAATMQGFGGFSSVKQYSYDVLLNYPCSDRQSTVQLVAGAALTPFLQLDLSEKSYDAVSDDLPPFVAYSPSAVAVGLPVYVNYGRVEDFAELATLGGNATGCICLARYGKIFRGDKVKAGTAAGCAGMLIFSDPADYARDRTKTYPSGPWLPADGAQRGSIFLESGDPLTPGMPALDGLFKYPMGDPHVSLPSIPVQPISYTNAEILMRKMGGPLAPAAWIGGLSVPEYRVGPGFAAASSADQGVSDDKIRLDVCSEMAVRNIYNTIAVIRGSEEPDRIVVAGNHQDAWGNRAIDPSTGSACMMELARSLSELLEMGWRPRRTIWLAYWDAEEYGLIGSTEFTDQFRGHMASRVVAYMNLDVAVAGTDVFDAAATPNLSDLIFRSAKRVMQPTLDDTASQESVYDVWARVAAANHNNNGDEPQVWPLGSGSDFTSFLSHHGVPSFDIQFTYADPTLSSYPVYHAQSDTFEYVANVLDPGFQFHAAITKIWIGALVELASVPAIAFNCSRYAIEIKQHLFEVVAAATAAGIPVDASHVTPSTSKFVLAAQLFDHKLAALPATVKPLVLRDYNDRLMMLERLFLIEEGLPGRAFFRHMIYAPAAHDSYAGSMFPGLTDAIYEKNVQEFSRQLSFVTIALSQIVDLLSEP
ncbi:naalad2 protein [Capsaspora owczarzaki ATCC 30864]|uniref:Naalad2 protein n=1 Tax=Capsaspora owczarzaki (strain ATCC 30864) TaxID=595528 RepID=A0A0D2UI55_CAPO3|nr:naalad2 protein [Capsaspora owczarzaki ATCC 30864]KJE94806.1 naalad2 protein [Capsaspora owczarzaki ATCC 30864]|eukprot:XP_004347068.2 naalad2 protein [Capsaspora owczarzaki ATCC 30864]